MKVPLLRGPRSISGHSLKGDRRVRFVFADESGNSAEEPVTVVASVIVHGDTQWKPLANLLAGLVKCHVPTDLQEGFVIHGVDLFSGKALKEAWPPHKSWAFLDDLLSETRDLPVAIGFCWHLVKSGTKWEGEQAEIYPALLTDPVMRVQMQHALAFLESMSLADRFIDRYHHGELGTVIAEDNKGMRKIIKAMPGIANDALLAHVPPLRSIVGTVHYAAKDEEPLLQLADVCAFIVRRHLAGLPNVDRFVDALGARERLAPIQPFVGGGRAMLAPARKRTVPIAVNGP